ncbi:MAG TPA: hypothetical protein DCY94_03330 [Firmicutes bacterium]|nr:hypothetical protein [Bacillota bacterium]
MKKILVNLKDWLNCEENVAFAREIDGMDVTVFPSLPYLYIYKDKNIRIGSQKISTFEEGAHTGSISASHLKDFGVEAVLLNHRECQIDDTKKICAKIKNAQEFNIEVILCIGSTDETELSKIEDVLKVTGTKGLSLAYEPVESVTFEKIKENITFIKDKFKDYNLSYIYGNNITADNFSLYNKEIDVDGFLISSHALNVDNLRKILDLAK